MTVKAKKALVGILLIVLLLGAMLPSFLAPQVAYADTETLRPNAAGDVTNVDFQFPASSSHWDKVDEVVADDDTTYVYSNINSYRYDLYNLPAHSGTGDINSVTIYIRCKKSSGSTAFARTYVKTNSVSYGGSENTLTTSWANYSTVYTTNPQTGVAWTWDEIDALQIGVGLLNYEPPTAYCTQVYAVVDYTPPVPITAPDITTTVASSVSGTTARLNATVVDDGGEACTVRWGWGETSESAIEDYDHFTSFAGSYETDDKPYYDVDSLDVSTLYYFRVEIQNSEDTELGGELQFTTTSGVDDPTNFNAYPSATSVSLSWTKGSGATNSVVRYRTDDFPSTYTDGFLVYEGSSSSYTHTDLLPGHTYYYAVWGYSGAIYSSGSAEVMVTTSAAVGGGDELDAPSTPLRWLIGTDYTNMENLPIWYDTVNFIADTLDMPRATTWFISSMLLGMLFAALIYFLSQGSVMMALIGLTVAYVFGYSAKQIPLAIPVLLGMILAAIFFVKRREAAG